MSTSTFRSQIVAADASQKQGKIWIPGYAMGPLVDAADGIGHYGGANAATTEILTTLIPIPWDMDVTAAISLQNYLSFDGVSDSDVFEIDHLYDITEKTSVVDPVHVAPTTAFTTEDAALTIVEATHESRIYIPGAATIAANAITAAQQTARDLLVLGWEITLTTMTETQFALIGAEITYTKRFV